MTACVIDASLVGALLFGEPRADEAYEQIKDADLYAPTLFDYELTSIARKKIRQHPDQRDDLLEAFKLGLKLDIQRLEIDHEAAPALASATDLSSYDASYLALARILDAPLATFDEQLRSAS